MNLLERTNRLFTQKGPILRTATLREHGITSQNIVALLASGQLKKLKTGYYIQPGMETHLSDMELAAAVVPQGVVCLFSAAALYELTTINPMAVDIAVPAPGNSITLPEYPPIALHKWAKTLHGIGITEVNAPQYPAKVYEKERTVCDFFRLRLQLGEDVALEVLKNYMTGTKNIQKLYDYAKALRVKTVLAPYVEALL